jgi:hypothetical protein
MGVDRSCAFRDAPRAGKAAVLATVTWSKGSVGVGPRRRRQIGGVPTCAGILTWGVDPQRNLSFACPPSSTPLCTASSTRNSAPRAGHSAQDATRSSVPTARSAGPTNTPGEDTQNLPGLSGVRVGPKSSGRCRPDTEILRSGYVRVSFDGRRSQCRYTDGGPLRVDWRFRSRGLRSAPSLAWVPTVCAEVRGKRHDPDEGAVDGVHVHELMTPTGTGHRTTRGRWPRAR